MKKKTPMITLFTFFVASVTVISFNSCNSANSSNVSQSEIDSLRNQINQLTANDATLAKNLASFDTLDYTVFTNQEWTRLHETHAKDIKVYWPDGHMTEGLEKHIEDLKMLFVYAPALHCLHQILVIIQSKMCDKVFSHHVTQGILQFDQLLEYIMLRSQASQCLRRFKVKR